MDEATHTEWVRTLNVLSVVPAQVSYEGRTTPIEFHDFVIDGRLLRERLQVPADFSAIEQETTALRRDWPHAAVEQIDRLCLTEPGDFVDGRVAILACPVCGDIDCGAVSATISVEESTVTWEEFGWQDGYTDDPPQPWLFEPQCFTFDKTAYLALMHQLREQFAELVPPLEEEEKQNRRPLLAWLRRSKPRA
ncbi:hypothetical protein [Arthrobacter tumbae]|uniref:hypothetical protein n=1 Tax=Arthrobacter tumbae TaxID=163874 RepID=UPI00195D610A|nr:hypothetical protein [Arthrobacter tumbae]MBM7781766.1 hypothetical protein [Arthrobacter tumbae]